MAPFLNINDVFCRQSKILNVNENDYAYVSNLIEVAKAFERSIYQSVYIIDYYKRNFLYVSDNIVDLCGYSFDDINNQGLDFYGNIFSEKDIEILAKMNDKGLEFIKRIPIADRIYYTLSFNIGVVLGNKRKVINHKQTPLLLTKDGEIWLVLCTMSLAFSTEYGNGIIKKEGSDSFHEYCLDGHKWEEKREIVLSDAEREVLFLSTQGNTMNDIAEQICKSLDTVKGYKRSIFNKMDVRNIAGALTYAQNHQLL